MAKIYDIIVDTDIGGDIDDTWAILTLLALPNVRIRLISVTVGNAPHKAALLAKLLTEAGRDDIPIAVGRSYGYDATPMAGYTEGYDLSSYRGKVYESYRGAYADVLSDDGELTVLCMAPFTSLCDVLDLFEKHAALKIIAMAGSIAQGYFGRPGPEPECNIVTDIEAARKFLSADLNIVLLPLDVCGGLILDGKEYARLKDSDSRLARLVLEQYRIWDACDRSAAKKFDAEVSSSILYDVICVWMLFFPLHFKVSSLKLEVDGEGRLIQTREGKEVLCALETAKTGQMKEFTVAALCGELKPGDIPVYDYQLFFAPKRPNMDLSIHECGWERCAPFHRYGPAKRYYYVLHFVESGAGYLTVNNERYNINKNQVFLLKPGEETVYGANPENPWKYYWVGFGGVEAKEVAERCGFGAGHWVSGVRHPEQIMKYMLSIVERRGKSDAAEYEMMGYLYLILSTLMGETPSGSRDGIDNSAIKRAVEYIHANYMSELHIEDLASYIGFTRSHFYKKFVEKMGVSPKEYLTSVRLEKALGLMRSKEYSLDQIAGLVGYEDYTSFARIFRKYHGMSPKEYREQPFENMESDDRSK